MNEKAPAVLELKVIPGAKRSAVAGWLGETLEVRVRASAERGEKRNAIAGLTLDEVQGRIGEPTR